MASEWDRHKDEITLLYLVEGLTLNDVSSQMVQRHGFDKKKHQYEYWLKKWKVSKNTKREMWEYVDHMLRKRENQQKLSEVRLRGVVLSDSRVRKATQRYGRRSLAGKFKAVPSPQSPGGQLLLIASPPASNSQISLLRNLPWMCFSRKFQLVHHPISESLMDLAGRALASCSVRFYAKNAESVIRAVLGRPLDWKTTLIPTCPRLDHRTDGLLRSSDFSEANVTATRVLQTLMFQISNKRINVEHPLLADNMMKIIYQLFREAPAAIEGLMVSTDPTSAVIKETFFAVAVRCGQPFLVAKFLAAGINPNAPIAHRLEFMTNLRRAQAWFVRKSSIQKATPLQIACAAGDVETASVLLEYRARPDFGTPSPLQIACSRPPSSDSSSLIQRLLENDVQLATIQNDVLLPPLLEAVASENTEIVQLLLDRGAMDQIVSTGILHSDPYTIGPGHLPFYLPEDRHAHDPFDYVGISLYERRPTITALQIAIVVGNSDIIEMLLLSTSDSNDQADIYRRSLVTGCLASDETMVRQLLGLTTEICNDKTWVNSVFCAISGKLDCQMAYVLLDNQIVPQRHEGLFVSAAQLAALHGNVNFLEILESCGYDMNASEELILFDESISNGIKGRAEHGLSLDGQPLDCAIRFKHSHTARILLQFGVDLTESALATALVQGNDEIVLNLLAGGVSIKKRSQKLIQLALQNGYGLAVIRKLIDAGAAIRRDELITAVREDAQEVIEFFLSCGLDILVSNAEGETVLVAAAQVGNLDMMHNYFNCGGNYSPKALFRAVTRAISTSDHMATELLIQHRPPGPMDTYESSSFVLAIWESESALIELFLALDAKPSLSYFCLHEGIEQLQSCKTILFEGLDLVLQKPCDMNSPHACRHRVSPMWVAAYMDEKTLLNDMIDRGYPPDAFLLTSALYAANFASVEVQDQLITAYPISSLTDETLCRKLLVEAIFWDIDSEFIQEHINSLGFLDFVANGNCLDDHGTPLQLAARYSNVGLVKALIDAGADVNIAAEGNMGTTALQGAVLHKRYDTVELLLERGADVNGLPAVLSGSTAIEEAASGGQIDLAALLLPHVALQGPMRIHFIRAVVCAEDECHNALAELLKGYGGWTAEDREIANTSRAQQFGGHTCPRFLYGDHSWDGECENCDELTDMSGTSTTSTFSDGDGSIVRSSADLMEVEALAFEYGADQSSGHRSSAIVSSQPEERDNIVMELAETPRPSYDATTRWLDDLARDFVDNLA